MKIALRSLLILGAAALGLLLAWSSEPSSGATCGAEPSAEDALRPGAEHAMLQKFAGTWEAVLTSHSPNGAEQKTKGALIRQKLSSYHTVDNFQGEFMGMPFLGQGIHGYCVVRKQYFTLWADSITPSPLTLYGDYNAEIRELTLKGECYGMSGTLEPCRSVTRFKDDDHFVWTFYGAGPDGKEMRHLAIEYTRRR